MESNNRLFKSFALSNTGDICAMQSVIGSIAAQEVMKVRSL